jgi:hypothetical protein
MDFSVRSDSVDVEQLMEQIRARIREKRGVDYTEQQLRELAAVKLEKFLDPRGIRSDLLQRFKERQPRYEPREVPLYVFEDTTIYETHRGLIRWIRKLLNPVLKLLFNPNRIIDALHAQAEINKLNLKREEERETRRLETESLFYELIHNLVFELTRTGIEVKNLKMRVESLASRLEFSERRARSLESVVAYKPASDERVEPPAREAVADRDAQVPVQQPPSPQPAGGLPPEGPGQRSRRRRRRRGRRSGAPASAVMAGTSDDQHDAGSDGERPETIEQAIAAESHPIEPPAPNASRTPAVQPFDSSPASGSSSTSGDDQATSSRTESQSSHEPSEHNREAHDPQQALSSASAEHIAPTDDSAGSGSGDPSANPASPGAKSRDDDLQ